MDRRNSSSVRNNGFNVGFRWVSLRWSFVGLFASLSPFSFAGGQCVFEAADDLGRVVVI